jgi:hypothetical protein
MVLAFVLVGIGSVSIGGLADDRLNAWLGFTRDLRVGCWEVGRADVARHLSLGGSVEVAKGETVGFEWVLACDIEIDEAMNTHTALKDNSPSKSPIET